MSWKSSFSSCTLTYKRNRPITSVPGLSSTNNLETTLGSGIFRLEVLKAWAHMDDEAVAITNAATTFAFSIGVYSGFQQVGITGMPECGLVLLYSHSSVNLIDGCYCNRIFS